MSENYTKQGYLLEDFRLFHLKSAAGVQTEYHYHEFYKLLMLVSGSGGYWIDGQRYALQPGDIVLVDSHCVHRPEFEPELPYERIIFYISPEFLQRESSEKCILQSCFSGKQGRVLRSEKGNRRLFQMAQELEKELSAGGFGSEISSTGMLLWLLVELYRQLRQGDGLQPGPGPTADPRVVQIMSYIDAHLTEELTIEAVAEQFYLSKFHMMRLFRAATGSSVNAYITQRRLLLARDLISQGIPATESCFRAGFGSYSSFTRTYGKFFGTTPTGRKQSARLQDESYE